MSEQQTTPGQATGQATGTQADGTTSPPTPAPVTPQAATQAPAQAQSAPQAPQAPTPPAPDQAQAGDKPESTITNLADALKVIDDLRAENARSRTTAKQNAADEARTEIAEAIAQALGLQPDPASAPDPQTQVQELTAQVEARTQAERQATRELAIYKTAHTAGADPERLLDSRSFLQSITDIDPTNTDALTEAIRTAVTQNPTLKATQAAGPSSVDHTPGGQGQPRQTLEQAAVALYGN